jgi:hypothetical protein
VSIIISNGINANNINNKQKVASPAQASTVSAIAPSQAATSQQQ